MQTQSTGHMKEADWSQISKVDLALKMRRLGVPSRAIEVLRSGPTETTALAAARGFIKGEKRILLLLGPVGVGKTIAAAQVVREFAGSFGWNGQPSGPKPEPVIWMHAGDFGRLGLYEDKCGGGLDVFMACRLAVLEDLGTEAANAINGSLFLRWVEARCGRGRTVISSNLNATAFKARYDQRVADRLRECATIVQGCGKSLRGAVNDK